MTTKELYLAKREWSKRKKRYDFDSIRDKHNVDYWRRTKWPLGIKIDLARISPLVLSSEEELIYWEESKHHDIWTVTQLFKNNQPHADVRRYFFPHPKTTVPEMPKWTRGAGFSIPAEHTPSWREGISRLRSLHHTAWPQYSGLFLYSISYGRKDTEGANFYHVRFSIDSLGGNWYYRIQAWRQFGETQWPTRKHLLVPTKKPRLLEAFDKALEWAQQYEHGRRPAKDCSEVELEGLPDDYDGPD